MEITDHTRKTLRKYSITPQLHYDSQNSVTFIDVLGSPFRLPMDICVDFEVCLSCYAVFGVLIAFGLCRYSIVFWSDGFKIVQAKHILKMENISFRMVKEERSLDNLTGQKIFRSELRLGWQLSCTNRGHPPLPMMIMTVKQSNALAVSIMVKQNNVLAAIIRSRRQSLISGWNGK